MSFGDHGVHTGNILWAEDTKKSPQVNITAYLINNEQGLSLKIRLSLSLSRPTFKFDFKRVKFKPSLSRV